MFECYFLYANISERKLGIAIAALKNDLKDLVSPSAFETPTHINSITRSVDASKSPPKIFMPDKIKTKGYDAGGRPRKSNEEFKSTREIIISKLPK